MLPVEVLLGLRLVERLEQQVSIEPYVALVASAEVQRRQTSDFAAQIHLLSWSLERPKTGLPFLFALQQLDQVLVLVKLLPVRPALVQPEWELVSMILVFQLPMPDEELLCWQRRLPHGWDRASLLNLC